MLNIYQTSLLLLTIMTFIYIINLYYLQWNLNTLSKKKQFISNVLGTVLIFLGIIKLYNLSSFVSTFNKYDLIASNVPFYGYIYPFLEIILGILFLKQSNIKSLYTVTIIFISINLLGVINGLQSKYKLKCGCMGSFVDLPLSYLTIIENLFILIKTIILLKLTN